MRCRPVLRTGAYYRAHRGRRHRSQIQTISTSAAEDDHHVAGRVNLAAAATRVS